MKKSRVDFLWAGVQRLTHGLRASLVAAMICMALHSAPVEAQAVPAQGRSTNTMLIYGTVRNLRTSRPLNGIEVILYNKRTRQSVSQVTPYHKGLAGSFAVYFTDLTGNAAAREFDEIEPYLKIGTKVRPATPGWLRLKRSEIQKSSLWLSLYY